MATYYPYDPNPRTPKLLAPPGTIDGQFHVFGPTDKYPVRAGAAYEMPSATFAEARRMHKALGIERGIVVQATTYGTDHRALLDALAEGGPNFRGCAVLRDEVSDADIETLHQAGVRGVRFNLSKMVNFAPDPATIARTIARVRPLGWYLKLQVHEGGLAECLPWFEGCELPIIIDHMGRADPALGRTCPTAQLVLELLKRGNWWLMLSNGHKKSKQGFPWDDGAALGRMFVEAAGDRVFWSSDWPHPLTSTPVPNDADLLELAYRYAPDELALRKMLVDNPTSLFGFNS